MRILVIDDEIQVADLIARAIQAQGHETTVTYDGEEGLALLTRHRPDAVFVLLPETSGIELLRRIRMTDSALPVVLITSCTRSDDLEEARRLGVTDIVEKPVVLRRLGEALGSLNWNVPSPNGCARRGAPPSKPGSRS